MDKILYHKFTAQGFHVGKYSNYLILANFSAADTYLKILNIFVIADFTCSTVVCERFTSCHGLIPSACLYYYRRFMKLYYCKVHYVYSSPSSTMGITFLRNTIVGKT